jgi:phage shock protein A
MPLSEEDVAKQALVIRLKQQLTELSKEIPKWRSRAELARSQGQTPLAEAAEQRVIELTERGRSLWKQLNDLQLEDRFARMEIDRELEALRTQLRGTPGVSE